MERQLSSFTMCFMVYHHLVSLNYRRTTVRMLEDVASALALLFGELGRKTLRINKLEEIVKCHPTEIQKMRNTLVERDSR